MYPLRLPTQGQRRSPAAAYKLRRSRDQRQTTFLSATLCELPFEQCLQSKVPEKSMDGVYLHVWLSSLHDNARHLAKPVESRKDFLTRQRRHIC